MNGLLLIVIVFPSCDCERVLYPMFRWLSSVITSPHATDVAFTSAVTDRVIAFISTLDSDVPACASVPHCDLCVTDIRLVANGDSLDDVLHCVFLGVVVRVYCT